MSATPPALVMVHSPLVGPSTWRAVAVQLEPRGKRCVLVDLAGAIAAGPPYLERMAGDIAAASDGPTVLVGHSGAGPLLAAAGERGRDVVGYVLVDATLPEPGATWMESVPGELASKVRATAVDGTIDPWPSWWEPGTLEALVPDERVLARFVAECPRLPVEMLEERQPALPRWPDAPVAYLQLDEGYAAEAATAAANGWPVRALDRHHLAVLTDPAGVADALLELLAAIVR